MQQQQRGGQRERESSRDVIVVRQRSNSCTNTSASSALGNWIRCFAITQCQADERQQQRVHCSSSVALSRSLTPLSCVLHETEWTWGAQSVAYALPKLSAPLSLSLKLSELEAVHCLGCRSLCHSHSHSVRTAAEWTWSTHCLGCLSLFQSDFNIL